MLTRLNRLWIKGITAGICGYAMYTGLPAQENPAQAGEEAIFELSPFDVVAAEDEGWFAGTTLVGTRTRQAIRDLPISVDAMTEEFLEDLGITSLQEAGFYIAGLDPIVEHERATDDGGTTYRGMELGGRENAQSSRNFFIWYARTDTYNAERIDFNKGSNSLMFGDASPGGLANVYTKRAYASNFGKLGLRYRSYDSHRVEVDVNRKITDNWFVRINAVDSDRRSYFDFASDRVRAFHFTTTIRPTKTTEIRFEAETMDWERYRANVGLAVNQLSAEGRGFSSSSWNYFTSDGDYYNPRTRLFYPSDGSGGFLEPFTIAAEDRRFGAIGDDLSLAVGEVRTVRDRRTGEEKFTVGPFPRHVNTKGTRDYLQRDVDNYTLWIEQRIGKLFIELAANRQKQAQDRNENSLGNTLSVDGSGRYYLETRPDIRIFGNEVDTLRANFAYPLDLGFTQQFLVASLSYQEDLVTSFRRRLVNKAQAFNPSTGEYDVTMDLEASHRINVRGYFNSDDPVSDMENPDIFNSLLPENLPYIPGVFEPIWIDYTTENRPYTDLRKTRSASLSSSGSFFNDKLRTLVGLRYDAFKLLRYKLPEGTRQELVDQWGELAWWGQDVYAGGPDKARDQYFYPDDLNQDAVTYSAGFSYALMPDLNLYGNLSTSFRWQGTEDFLGRVLGPQEGKTWEIGLKGDFLNRKLSATLAVFEVERDNVAFQLDTQIGPDGLERLFNDVRIDIFDGQLEYVYAVPGDPGFLEIPNGLNQEHRQITSSETSRGVELTLANPRRMAGFRFRLTATYLDMESDRDITDYAEQVRLAEQRAAERAVIIEQFWPNDPNYFPGSTPFQEIQLQASLKDAQNVVAANSVRGLITGQRARPWNFGWLIDYRFEETFLKDLRTIVSGRWRDDYLLSTFDGVEWYGGGEHTVDLSFIYDTKIFGMKTSFRFKIWSLYDFKNRSGKRANGGFVDDFTGERVVEYRNVTPRHYDLSVTVNF